MDVDLAASHLVELHKAGRRQSPGTDAETYRAYFSYGVYMARKLG